MTELEDQMRARFRELTAERDGKRAAAAPLREARDTAVQAAQAAMDAAHLQYDAAIAEQEDGLFDIDQEIARISRFLDGKTGEIGPQD